MASNPMTPFLGRPQSSRPANNPLAMLAEFKRFAAGITPQQAEQEINRLLQSGQMSQQQYEDLKQQAQALLQFLQ